VPHSGRVLREASSRKAHRKRRLLQLRALHQAAERDGLWVRSVNGDAFSDEIKQEVAQVIEQSMGKVDLVVYSLASPKRTNPRTGLTHTSSLKAIGSPFTGKTIDLGNGTVGTASVEAAAQAEIDETVAVMGGEDWRWWIEGLADSGLLARGAQTLAYSYYGPAVTWPIYKDGTIGAAKRDLKATADRLNAKLEQEVGGSARVAVNKAVVTQASAAIPVVPLYVSLLFRVMKAKGIHEGCIEQMTRLVRDHLAAEGGPRCDADGLIRLDDLEMRVDVQDEIAGLWPTVGTDNLAELADFAGFRGDFNNLFGFDVDGVDYDLPVETEVFLP